MRVALLADVHSNLEALRAVLAALDARGYDTLTCAGDLVGYGPSPNECVRELRDRGARSVAGNHDLMVLGRMGLERCVPDGRRAARWTRRVLEPDVRIFLDGLPLVQEVFPGIVVCHGSLDDPDAYISTRAAAQEQLRALRERFPSSPVLVCGHTHRRALRVEGGTLLPAAASGTEALPGDGPWLINPGSVGQSRDERPLARCALYDSDRLELEWLSLPYDLAACEARIHAAGLTTQLYLPRPSLVVQARRVVRRAARRGLKVLREAESRWRKRAAANGAGEDPRRQSPEDGEAVPTGEEPTPEPEDARLEQ